MARIHIEQGDITESDAEAIVNAANNHLWMGAGVAGAIKRKGGIEIEEEARKRAPIPIGTAVETTAGRLKARYVIHAAVMGQDLQTDEEKIRAATRNALDLADELAVRSIAFPALGTGVGGFPLEKAALIMLHEARAYSGDAIEEIIFVLFDEAAFRAFEQEWRRFERSETPGR